MGVSQKDVEKFHNADNSEGLEESKRLVSEEEVGSNDPYGDPFEDRSNSGDDREYDSNNPLIHIDSTLNRHGV